MERNRGRTKLDKLWQTVERKTADYSVLASDSGKLLVANKAGTFTFTLPALATSNGCVWTFIQMQDQTMTITGAEADKIVCKNDAAATSVSFSTASQKIGACCMVWCDGTNYFFANLSTCTETPA